MAPSRLTDTAPSARTDGQAEVLPSAPRNWIMGAEAFERRMPHHDGIKALWETKWKHPVSGLVR